MKRLIDMKVKQQILNRHVTFLIVQVTDAQANNMKEQDLVLLINGNTYFYKNAPKDMFAQTYQIQMCRKKMFSILVQNISWTRNCIPGIPIYIIYENIFITCYMNLFVSRMYKRWDNYVA
jgi:hypothetical protein